MRAKRVDDNQKEIVKCFRDCMALVYDTSAVGGGFPDIVVQARGETYLVEIKDGSKPPSRRKLTPAQEEFHKDWYVTIVKSKEDVYRLLRVTV